MQSFTLAVFPDGGLATHLELIEAPPAGEILERIVTIESEYVLFQAQVVTADGVGIRPDRIEIATEYRESELILAAPDADEEGRFSASLCHPGTVSVTIRKKGFPDLCVDSFSVDSVGEHLFTLAEGRRVAVHVTTEAGEGVPAIVEIYYAGNQVGSKRCGADGIAVITAIPHEDCTTRVVYAGKEYLNALGSFEEETKFIVDSSGQLRIRCSAELEDAQSRGLLMLAVRPLAEGGAEVRQPLTREGFTSLPLVTGRYDLSLLELDLEAFARRLIREVRQIEILAGEITELLL